MGVDTTARSTVDVRRRLLADASGIAAARDMAEASARLTVAAYDEFACDRVYCLFHDAENGAVWSEAPDERQATVADGIVGEAIRSKRAIFVRRCAEHPSYLRHVDDPT